MTFFLSLSPLFIIAAGIFGLLASPLWSRAAPYVIAFTLAALAFCFGFQSTRDLPLRFSAVWSEYFGLEHRIIFDGLSLTFAMLITGIGAVVFLYASAYFKPKDQSARFYLTLSIFTAAMLGLVLSDNLILTFMCWEITSVCSFLLICSQHERPEVTAAARKALFVTLAGGLALLVAIVLISHAGTSAGQSLVQSLTISELSRSALLSESYFGIMFFLAIAVATKSAQFPFHFWLPAAMAGPTPVSSFLHSATMVKAGIFLLARLFPQLGATTTWMLTFTTMGALTMIVGSVMAASHRDIKKILAYTTIAVLGILVMLLGIGTPIAVKAAVVFLVAHAFYKASLFQVVGNIDKAVGSRNLETVHGLVRFMPLTAAAATLSAFSMAGSPPLFGFFGKELAYAAKLDFGVHGLGLMVLAVLANMLLVGLAMGIAFWPFWRKSKKPSTPRGDIQGIPLLMSFCPFLLSLVGLAVGIFPALFDSTLGTLMASSILGQPVEMKLKLWHGVSPEALLVVGLSAVTLLGGITVTLKLRRLIFGMQRLTERATPFGPEQLYERFMNAVSSGANDLTDALQTGNLLDYCRWLVVTGSLLIAIATFDIAGQKELVSPTVLEAIFIVIMILLSVGVVRARERGNRVLVASTIGFLSALVFMSFSAPDLALTQIAVEALSIAFLLFFLFHRQVVNVDLGPSHPRRRDSIVAAWAGLVLFLVLLPTSESFVRDAAAYFTEESFESAFGRNVVNVILVDFRAMDTFGEVLVIAVTAIAVAALLSPRETKGQAP